MTLGDEKIQLTERSGADSLLSSSGGESDPAQDECVDDELTICPGDNGLFNFEELSDKAALWHTNHPESTVIIAAQDDLTTGVVQQAIAALLHRGDEELFSDFSVAIVP